MFVTSETKKTMKLCWNDVLTGTTTITPFCFIKKYVYQIYACINASIFYLFYNRIIIRYLVSYSQNRNCILSSISEYYTNSLDILRMNVKIPLMTSSSNSMLKIHKALVSNYTLRIHLGLICFRSFMWKTNLLAPLKMKQYQYRFIENSLKY